MINRLHLRSLRGIFTSRSSHSSCSSGSRWYSRSLQGHPPSPPQLKSPLNVLHRTTSTAAVLPPLRLQGWSPESILTFLLSMSLTIVVMHVNGADAFFFSSSPEKEREKEREEAIKSMDTRSEGQVAVLDAKLNKGVHFVLIHADWCAPCQTYKPVYYILSKLRGTSSPVSFSMIHYDMVPLSKVLSNAQLVHYPAVVKVVDGVPMEFLYEWVEYGERKAVKCNAMSNIRDYEFMKKIIIDT